MSSLFSSGRRPTYLALIATLIIGVAIADWRTTAAVPFGFGYLLPIVIAGALLNRWYVITIAILCAVLAELFDGLEWSVPFGLTRDFLYVTAFTGIGLFTSEITERRKAAAVHLRNLNRENQARRDAEEQLENLIESSPVAIVTVDAGGSILFANNTAHRLLGLPAGALPGTGIAPYLPSLAKVPQQADDGRSFRTMMQCKGMRQDGEPFLADVWFSTYRTSAGPRLAAMIVDTSEDFRDREQTSFEQLLFGSRILVSAVSHEIRNICGAISVVHENLSRDTMLAHHSDFEALGTLTQALKRIAAMELRDREAFIASIDLHSFFEELMILLRPSLQDEDIRAAWSLPGDLPPVLADHHSLMQVFLNLAQNSRRAIAGRQDASFSISAHAHQGRVEIAVADNGPGVEDPSILFRPFEGSADSTGLGLYLSRALLRSFDGNLRYEPAPQGALFIVDLATDPDAPRKGQD
ncbi:ATP-binding protein [Silvibacterium sp.]|uniref:ATP-binding protein n=1 Tax=Silvibacterium sp. TaxID=1964179 RepID=UPI0039E516A0